LTTAPAITTIYAKFGIPESATTEQVVQAYLRLATKLQTGVQAQDEKAKAQFQSLANAYFVLSDATEKRRYDQYIAETPAENFKLSQRPPAADVLFEQAAEKRAMSLANHYANGTELANALISEGLSDTLAQRLAHAHAKPDLMDFNLELEPMAAPEPLLTLDPVPAPAAPSAPTQQDAQQWQQAAPKPGAQPIQAAAAFQPYAPPQSVTQESLPTQSEVVYAGFWERFAAYILDALIAGFVGVVVAGICVGIFRSPGLGQLINLVCGVAYFAAQEASQKRATLGKRAIGLHVITTDGRQLSLGRAIGRYFARLISAFTLMIGYLMQPFTEKRQTLHDMITDTIVVRDPTRKPASALVIIIVAIVPIFMIMVFGILAAIAIPQFAAYQTKAYIKAGQVDGRNALTMLIADHDGNHPYPEHRSFPHSPSVEAVEFDADQQVVVVKFATPDLNKTPMYVYTIRNGAQTCYMLPGHKAADINACPENAASDLHD
jgi:uncharacterized RDD family membrane protein YckC